MNNVVEFAPRVPGAPRRGEVFSWAGWYVVVISNDRHNAQFDPWCLLITRALRGSAYAVELSQADPVAGRVAIHPVLTMDAQELSEPQGMLTGSTLARITAAVTILISDD